MTNVDQFESTFRSAAKPVFAYEPLEIRSVLVLTDLEEYDARLLADRIRGCFAGLGLGGAAPDGTDAAAREEIAWNVVHGTSYRAVPDLLALVEQDRPDLICTYRHLYTEGWKWPFTLGDHLEVLTQAVAAPVFVVPHPKQEATAGHALANMDVVMAMTDHLSGDGRLVSAAARFTEPGGTLFLTHVEDQAAFERTLGTIGRIPEIDTDVARETIREQLLKEPKDYIASCRKGLEAAGMRLTVEEIVTIDHRLAAYTRLVTEHEVDLLVINTKDDDQMAMHGLAYPLAVEMRQIPLLMI